jgi:hypothetical protein
MIISQSRAQTGKGKKMWSGSSQPPDIDTIVPNIARNYTIGDVPFPTVD